MMKKQHSPATCFNFNTQAAINDLDINDSLKAFYQIIGDYINVSVYNLLAGSLYMQLPEQLRNPKKKFNQYSK